MIALAARQRTSEQVRLLKYWCHQMETAGESIEQFGLSCLEIHGVLAETSRDPLLRSVIGVVELTLALALTRDGALCSPDYRAASVSRFQALIAAVEQGDADQAAILFESIRALDRAQVLA